MLHNTLRLVVAICFACLTYASYGQGQISRPNKYSQTSSSKKRITKNKVSEPDAYINGHGYVDLGLPSGTKWATCNIGATKSHEYGDYFAWGETQPKKKYSKQTSLIGNNNLGNISHNPKYDAATYNWGSYWQMPTYINYEELKQSCKWTTIWHNGVYGHKAVGPNGKSIFFPCGGSKINDTDPYIYEGYYLTSDHDGYGPKWVNLFGDKSIQGYGDIEYFAGRNIRAVVHD